MKNLALAICAAAIYAAPLPAAEPQPKEWTVMLFMNGNAGLEPLDDINEMEEAGPGKGLNIVAEVGMPGWTKDGKPWAGSRRFLIAKDPGKSKTVVSPVIYEEQGTDMGDWRRVGRFVEWTKARYPARRYALVFWGHGAGWQPFEKPVSHVATRNMLPDFNSHNEITTAELGALLARLGGMDLVASDACLMADAAVDYQIAPYAGYIVASQETVPGAGNDYAALFGALSARPGMSAGELASLMVDVYGAFYTARPDVYKKAAPPLGGATLSAVKASEMEGLAARLDSFASLALAEGGDLAAVKAARDEALRFNAAGSVDLYDFMRQTARRTRDPALAAKAKEIGQYLAGTLVTANAAVGSYAGRARGLSVYVPSPGQGSAWFGPTGGFEDLRLGKTAWGALASALAK